MRNARFERLLAGTAAALALSLTPCTISAFAASDAQISAAVPMPPVDDLSPPTINDIKPAPVEAKTPAGAKAAPAKATPSGETTASVAPAEKVADSPAGEKLRALLATGKFDRVFGGKKERTAVDAFYAARNYAPLWIADGALSDRAKAAESYLAKVGADGLDPSDYVLPQIKATLEPDAAAEAEIKFTDTVLTYVRHAAMGRVHYSRVANDILYILVKPEPAEVLAKLAAGDVRITLDSYEPQQPGYKALKAKLAEVRGGADVAKPMIPSGPVLKYGRDKKGKEEVMQDARVPALREWFSLPGKDGDTNYDKALSEAIATFQKEQGLPPTGQLTQATLDTINGPKREKTADIIVANLERWRWLPRDLGQAYVMVNIPDFTLRVMHDNRQVWKTKVVTGKPGMPTPLTSADMKFITVNPTWNVPPSIIQNEYLPALQQDPQAMERIGLRVEQNPDGTIRIYQPPGDKNALGRIRFNFPNKFLVYQHDTPDKYLFAHAKRAYSHGCMRVENPVKYAEVLLGLVLPKEHYTEDRIHRMIGGGEININFPTFIPVHLTYQTAFVDDAGKLQIRDDVYGRDARMLAMLKGSDRKIADIAIERGGHGGASSAAVRMPPGTFGGGFGAGGFFARLFGAPEPMAPRPQSRVGNARDRHSYR
jgi:L,D-transpeptidase YcbB